MHIMLKLSLPDIFSGGRLAKVHIEHSNVILIGIVGLLVLVTSEGLHDLSLPGGQGWIIFPLNSVQILDIVWHHIHLAAPLHLN